MENQGSSICFHGFLDLSRAQVRLSLSLNFFFFQFVIEFSFQIMLGPLPSGRKFKPRKAWFSGNRQSCRNLGFPDFISYFINFSIRSGSVFYPRNLACSDPAWVYDQETLLFVFRLRCIDFEALCAQGGNRRSLSRAKEDWISDWQKYKASLSVAEDGGFGFKEGGDRHQGWLLIICNWLHGVFSIYWLIC
ncbi:uncharacterized protein LOC103933856 [Pyrus x bretschneideri]|uniref:uncharacterized protein LOC103933856 n=1 Tax=Pyrus x bretschneideri TaxID=225117 RepID=UPI00202DF0D3|nr:uncharacterized protein LOC103933856 [Pyrus x bretschneideri]